MREIRIIGGIIPVRFSHSANTQNGCPIRCKNKIILSNGPPEVKDLLCCSSGRCMLIVWIKGEKKLVDLSSPFIQTINIHLPEEQHRDRKSTRLNSSHTVISY